MLIMQQSLKIFTQPKHKAIKFQQNNSINPSQRTNITHIPAQAKGHGLNWAKPGLLIRSSTQLGEVKLAPIHLAKGNLKIHQLLRP